MIVHDHLDGSARCVECKGPCQLTGDELNVSRLVRWTLEFAEVAHDGWMWQFTRDTLADILGADRLEKMQAHCKQSNKKGTASATDAPRTCLRRTKTNA